MSVRTRTTAIFAALGLLAGSAVLVSAAPAGATAIEVTVTSAADTAGTCPSATNCTLRQALLDASLGGFNNGDDAAITIAPGITTITLLSAPLEYDGGNSGGRSLTITGNDTTILGDGTFRLFQDTTSGSTVLDGLNFSQGGSNSVGGAMQVVGPLTINNSLFDYNVASGTGGAIYAANALTLNNVSFEHNHTPAVGGAVFAGSTVTATDTSFTANLSGTNGGALYAAGIATLTRTEFADNAAYGDGGAIAAVQSLTATDSSFSANYAPNAAGAIMAGTTVTLTRTQFTDNHCGGLGGAVNTDYAIVSDSVFTGNYTNNDGGAIWASSDANISNTEFSGNSTLSNGGAVFVSGVTTLSNVLFSENHTAAGFGSGGGIESLGDLHIDDSDFLSNASGIVGGAIECGANIFITDSRFTSNTADSYGGAITCNGSALIDNSSFVDNSSLSEGGALEIYGDIDVSNSTFADNHATTSAGAMASGNHLTITNSTLSNNTAAGPYSTLVADQIVLTSSTLTGLSSSPSESAISSYQNDISIFATVLLGASSGNAGTLCNSAVTSLGYNYATDTSCGLAHTGDVQGASATTPVVGALADHGGSTATQLPLVNSPLVGAIPNGSCMASMHSLATDQRGFARPNVAGGPCDIGAVQLTPQTAATTSGRSVTVNIAEFTSAATVTLHSDPIVLGTISVDATGSGTATYTIDCSVPAGTHNITAESTGGQTATSSIELTVCDPEVVPVYAG